VTFEFETDPTGKYDDVATTVREMVEAEMIGLFVIKGNNGTGFTVQSANPVLLSLVPDMLESMARNIREQQNGKLQ
jgi:hypothetical protein